MLQIAAQTRCKGAACHHLSSSSPAPRRVSACGPPKRLRPRLACRHGLPRPCEGRSRRPRHRHPGSEPHAAPHRPRRPAERARISSPPSAPPACRSMPWCSTPPSTSPASKHRSARPKAMKSASPPIISAISCSPICCCPDLQEGQGPPPHHAGHRHRQFRRIRRQGAHPGARRPRRPPGPRSRLPGAHRHDRRQALQARQGLQGLQARR